MPQPTTPDPTVVLVHGAFADASSWHFVMDKLARAGLAVIAPPNALRGVSADANHLRAFLGTIEGPVVLVGHSYGGMVITGAAAGVESVKALVYVAAYAPDEGDSVASLNALGTGGMIGPDTLVLRPYPTDGEAGLEGYISAAAFHEVFAADLPAPTAALMAASQRPGSLVTQGEAAGPAAWKSIPAWAVVAGADHAIGADTLRAMAARIGARTTEVAGASHVVMISHPDEVCAVILDAVESLNAQPAAA